MTKVKLAGLGLAAMIAVGCGGSDVAVNPVTPLTNVRGVHAASPDTGAIDLFVNQTRVVAGGVFGQASTFVTPPAGDVRVQVTAANTVTPVLIDALQTFQAGLRYTVLAVGRSTTDPRTLTQVTVVENTSPPTTGNAKIRVIHGNGGAGAWDFFIVPTGTAFTTPTFEDVPFAGQAPGVGQPASEFAAGNYDILITPANTPGTTLFRNTSVTISAGQDLILVGVPRGGEASPSQQILAVPVDANPFIINNVLPNG